MRCVLACCLAWLACAPAGAADLVLYNGRLWTGDPDLPQASAIAIGGGRILAVGSDSQVLARAGQARRIDLGGRRVVPGINDAHVHLGAWWESTFLELASPDPGLAELEAAIRAAPGPADGWISASIGPTAFNDPALDQARLDAWQPRRPVILQAFTGHGTVVNSAARQRLGIDPSAPVPGGWYGTGADGAFDGRLYEYAQWRMRLSQPPLPDAVEIADLQGYSQQLLRWGTTSIQAMAALPAERMLALWQRSGAPQRLRLVRTPLPARWGEPVDGASLHAPAGSRVQVSGTKWILDGTPIEGGAATRAPGLVATMLAAMPQEHERSLGLWHAEWETLPELCCLVSGALQQALQLVPGLEVDAARMRANLDLTRGLVLAEAVSIALAQRIGRDAAHHLLEQCCKQAVKEGAHLRAVLGANAEVTAHLSAAELDQLLDPAHYLGQARRWVARALAEHHALSR